MNRAMITSVLALVATGLGSCATEPDVYDRPRTSSDQFRQDFATCKMYAKEIPQQQTPIYSYEARTTVHNNTATTTVGPNPYVFVAAALGDALKNSANYADALHLCMESKGYALRPKKGVTFDDRKFP